MTLFWNLVRFEFLKILRKRSTLITLTLAFLAAVLTMAWPLAVSYPSGDTEENGYAMMVKNRENARALSGRAIDETLLSETAEAFLKISRTQSGSANIPEYEKYTRPYQSSVLPQIQQVYHISLDDREALGKLTREDFKQFYPKRMDLIQEFVSETHMTEAEKAATLETAARAETPFKFSYQEGFLTFFSAVNTFALLISIACAICLAPIFAGECTERMDSLILSSRYGKNKVITAKLFTGTAFTFLLCLLLLLVPFLFYMAVYGADGAASQLQAYLPIIISPFTLGQATWMLVFLVLCASVFFTALTMLLSSAFKSPFFVVVMMSLLTIIPLFITIPESNIWLFRIFKLFPVNLSYFDNVFGMDTIGLFGIYFPFHVLAPIICLLLGAVSVLCAYRIFRRHQC